MPALRMYLEAAIGEAGVAFGEHAFHAHKKWSFEFKVFGFIRVEKLRGHEVKQGCNLFVVRRMDVLIKTVTGEFDLMANISFN